MDHRILRIEGILLLSKPLEITAVLPRTFILTIGEHATSR